MNGIADNGLKSSKRVVSKSEKKHVKEVNFVHTAQ